MGDKGWCARKRLHWDTQSPRPGFGHCVCKLQAGGRNRWQSMAVWKKCQEHRSYLCVWHCFQRGRQTAVSWHSTQPAHTHTLTHGHGQGAGQVSRDALPFRGMAQASMAWCTHKPSIFCAFAASPWASDYDLPATSPPRVQSTSQAQKEERVPFGTLESGGEPCGCTPQNSETRRRERHGEGAG